MRSCAIVRSWCDRCDPILIRSSDHPILDTHRFTVDLRSINEELNENEELDTQEEELNIQRLSANRKSRARNLKNFERLSRFLVARSIRMPTNK